MFCCFYFRVVAMSMLGNWGGGGIAGIHAPNPHWLLRADNGALIITLLLYFIAILDEGNRLILCNSL